MKFSLSWRLFFSMFCTGGMFENCMKQAILALQLGVPNVSKSSWIDLKFKAAMLCCVTVDAPSFSPIYIFTIRNAWGPIWEEKAGTIFKLLVKERICTMKCIIKLYPGIFYSKKRSWTGAKSQNRKKQRWSGLHRGCQSPAGQDAENHPPCRKWNRIIES